MCLLMLLTHCQKPKSSQPPELSPLNDSLLTDLILSAPEPYIIVNFYNTHSVASQKEIPELIALEQFSHPPVRVVFVSLDTLTHVHSSKLANFLSKLGGNIRSFYFEQDSIPLNIRKIRPYWSGSLPLNLIYDNKGRLVEITGQTDRHEIELILRNDLFSQK